MLSSDTVSTAQFYSTAMALASQGQMICRKLSYHAGSRWLVLAIEQEVPNLNSTTQRQDYLSPASFFPSLTPSAIFSYICRPICMLAASTIRLTSIMQQHQ
jgi:hypothetical protein